MHAMPKPPPLNDDYERRPYWWATMPPMPDRSGRALPADADAVIVGGGYTGLSAARELARNGTQTVVLDSETIGWGASSRNGGIAHPGFKWSPGKLVKRYGPELARALYRESQEGTDLLERTIRENAIDAELRYNGWLELAWAPSHVAGFADEARELTEFGSPARVVSRKHLREEIGTPYYHGGLAIDRGGLLHPAKWVGGLAALAERDGAQLHDGVRAKSIKRQGDGRFAVETTRGTILARDVLIATNGYTGGVAPSLRRRIMAIGSYIIATEQLPEDLARELAPTGRAFFDTANFLSYWHVSADRRMVFGGRVSFMPTTVDKTAVMLHERMLRVHPQLAGYRVEYSWGGKVALTMDRMPHIGRAGGVMYALGYTGTGVVMSHWLGMRAAQWMGGGEPPALAKLRFPIVPAPYEGKPWFLPFAGEVFRLRDRLGAREKRLEE